MPLRILVIDDEPTVRSTLRMLLTRASHEVEIASSGEEGVERARTMLPDIIVCDSKMPGLSGRETVAQLRSESVTAKIPVVIISGNETPATAAYAEAFVAKPFQIGDLLNAIRSAVEQGVRRNVDA